MLTANQSARVIESFVINSPRVIGVLSNISSLSARAAPRRLCENLRINTHDRVARFACIVHGTSNLTT